MTSEQILEFWETSYIYFSREKLEFLLNLSSNLRRDVGENGLIFSFKQNSGASIPMETLIAVNELDIATPQGTGRHIPVRADAIKKGEVIAFTKKKSFKSLLPADLYDVIFFPEDQIRRLISHAGVAGVNFYGAIMTLEFPHPAFNAQRIFNIVAECTTDKTIINGPKSQFFIGHPCPPIWKS